MPEAYPAPLICGALIGVGPGSHAMRGGRDDDVRLMAR